MKNILVRLLRGVRFLTIGTVGGLLLAGALLVFYQNALILPSSISPDPGPAAPEDVEERMLETEDHERIRLWHFRNAATPDRKLGSGRAMLILHGNGDTVRSSMYYQNFFSQLGFTTYSIDYRGTGGSSGTPSEAGLYKDVEAAWKYVTSKHPASTVTLFGRSFGTGLASYLAEKFAARSLVLISPYLSIPKIVQDRGAVSVLKPFLKFDIPADRFIKNLRQACVIATHGVQDRIIEVHHTEELAVPAGSQSILEKIIIPDADHDSIFPLAQERMLKAMQNCFDRSA